MPLKGARIRTPFNYSSNMWSSAPELFSGFPLKTCGNDGTSENYGRDCYLVMPECSYRASSKSPPIPEYFTQKWLNHLTQVLINITLVTSICDGVTKPSALFSIIRSAERFQMRYTAKRYNE